MLDKKALLEYNKLGVSVPGLIERYEKGYLTDISPIGSLALLNYAILINLKLYACAKK